MRASRLRNRRLLEPPLIALLLLAGCDNGMAPVVAHPGQHATDPETCPVDTTGNFNATGDDIDNAYNYVASAIANGTAVQPPDSQTQGLMDGTPGTASSNCEGCSDLILPSGSARLPDQPGPTADETRQPQPPVAQPDSPGNPKPGECNCPSTSWAFGNWSLPTNYGLDPCGSLPSGMKPFLFKPYTNACKNDTDCKKLLTQAMENCQKILEILKDQAAGKNTGICQQTQSTRMPSFGACEVNALKGLGCTNGGKSGDIWKCPPPANLPAKPCTSMTDYCGKAGGFVSCASDMWNTLNATDIKAGKKKSCTFTPKAGNSC